MVWSFPDVKRYNKIVIYSDNLYVNKSIQDNALVKSNFVLINRNHQILLQIEYSDFVKGGFKNPTFFIQ